MEAVAAFGKQVLAGVGPAGEVVRRWAKGLWRWSQGLQGLSGGSRWLTPILWLTRILAWSGFVAFVVVAFPFLVVLRSSLRPQAKGVATLALVTLYALAALQPIRVESASQVAAPSPAGISAAGPTATPAPAPTASPAPTPAPQLTASPTPTPTPQPTPTFSPYVVTAPPPTPTPRQSFRPEIGSQARLAVISATAKSIPMGATTDDLDAVEKALYANDTIGVRQLLLSGRAVAIPDGTKALVIDLTCLGFLCTSSAYRIRILDGDYAGHAGWVRGDFLAAP